MKQAQIGWFGRLVVGVAFLLSLKMTAHAQTDTVMLVRFGSQHWNFPEILRTRCESLSHFQQLSTKYKIATTDKAAAQYRFGMTSVGGKRK